MRMIEAIAKCVNALSVDTITPQWRDIWQERLDHLTESLPSGSGFDSGTSIIMNESHSAKIVFKTSFHHMDDNGFYDGWTHHRVICLSNFIGSGIDIRVQGYNKRGIKEYIADTFHHVLNETWEF